MRRLRRRTSLILALALVLVATGTVVVIAQVRSRSAAAAELTVGSAPIGRALPSDFMGISFEYRDLPLYAGTSPHSVHSVFVQLLRNLDPGNGPSIRIGGDSTDWSWYPIPHTRRPSGVRFTLTRASLGVMRSLAVALGSKLILGVNLEVDSRRVAGAESHALLKSIGASRILAFELGNEPELYGGLPWYVIHHHRYYGRTHHHYHFAQFDRDFGQIAAALPRLGLAGPDAGSDPLLIHLGSFLRDHPRVSLATMHRYPLKVCSASAHVSIDELLAPSSSNGVAHTLTPYARAAQAHHVPVRLDEMNAVSCGGEPGVSDTYATALWAPDYLFALNSIGINGVNVHSRPGSSGELFTFSHAGGAWRVHVRPEYYGLMLFALAAPVGSRPVSVTGSRSSLLRVWATSGPGGKRRVLVINDAGGARSVSLRIPGAVGRGSVLRLRGPGLHAHRGITLGDRTFDPYTSTGVLARLHTESLAPAGGRYPLRLPAMSAALLTVSGG